MPFEMTIVTSRTVDGVREETNVKVKNGESMENSALASLIVNIWKKGTAEMLEAAKPKLPPPPEPKLEVAKPVPVARPVQAPSTEDWLRGRAEQRERARQLPLMGAKDTGFTVADRMEPKKPVKGDYVPVSVDCPLCGHNEQHDTGFGYLYTKCRGCGEKLHLTRATEEHGVPDEDGFAYYARERYLTRYERWEMEQAEQAK